jgi:hypothetical protein
MKPETWRYVLIASILSVIAIIGTRWDRWFEWWFCFGRHAPTVEET